MTFMPPEKKKKAALYVRVSTHHQIDKDSLPLQRQDLINYAKYVLHIEDYEIFEDAGYSGKNTDRPMYREMMDRIRKGEFSHLLVWKIDRISRNLRDFSDMYDELKKYKVTFISKNEQFDTSTAMGEAMLKIILVFAELERQLTSERVTAVMLSRAEQGLWNGATVPIGFAWSEEEEYPVADDEETAVVRYVYDLYEKLMSTGEVAFQLNEENVRTKRGGQWTPKTVRDILRNSFYIGTYSYNKRESDGSHRLRPESEWIVKPNNHPAVVSEEQFERVNKILTDNFKGIIGTQRENIHTHVFAKKLYCGVCGSLLTAGLDAARADGFQPSRYTCSTNKTTRNIHSCNSFVSDILVAPFILNYVSNLIRLQDSSNPSAASKRSLTDISRMLLRGSAFIDVAGIDREALQETYLMSVDGYQKEAYSMPEGEETGGSLALEKAKKERDRHTKALERLDELYLYGEEAMSQKDFILKKNKIVEKIEEAESEIRRLLTASGVITDHSFLNDARNFLIAQALNHSRDIDFKELIDGVGKEALADFVDSVVDRATISDKCVMSITFKNGITHSFTYFPKEERKTQIQERGKYKQFIDTVLIYLKEQGPASRTDIEKLTNLKRSSVYTLLQELMDQDLVVKKGNSVAIRYFYNGDDA
ncbi:recombinase family protein [Sporosarcina sp. FSL K6-1508]|uniref:recombinase family protein n=1 Tax=Sporosarcina sp. FSL K6-1508 TaxID=2921553 RepID=UPI0030F9A84C